MRNDGKITIFVLETRQPCGENKWFRTSLDHFGSPPGFTASDKGWQQTGIFGTFDEDEGLAALKAMSREHIEYDWRLMRLEISQHHYEVATMSAKAPNQKPPDGYPVTNEMRRRYEAIHKG